MSAPKVFSRLTSHWKPQSANTNPAWHHSQASLVDIRLPGLESGGIVTVGSFRNQLLSLKIYFSERPRPPWLPVSILVLAGFAVLCTTLWLLASLDWPFVSGGKGHYVARRKNEPHRDNGTAPPPFEDVRTGPASIRSRTPPAGPTNIEMDSVPSKSDVPPGSADDETTLLTSDMDSVPSSSDVPPVSPDDEPTLLTSDIDGADSSFLSSEEALTEDGAGSVTTGY